MKEHTIIVVMANASFAGGVAYATDILLAQEVFYKQFFGWWFQLLLVITSQMIGFGMAGIVRRFLVWPSAMIWPSTLVNCSMFYALHDHKESDPAETNGWSIGKYRWFLYVFTVSFVWYWFPGALIPVVHWWHPAISFCSATDFYIRVDCSVPKLLCFCMLDRTAKHYRQPDFWRCQWSWFSMS